MRAEVRAEEGIKRLCLSLALIQPNLAGTRLNRRFGGGLVEMPGRGLEPLLCKEPDPKSCADAPQSIQGKGFADFWGHE